MDDRNITTEILFKSQKWCCRYGKEDCIIDNYSVYDNKVKVKSVTCSGKALPLSQQCHDGDDTTPVCNYIHSTPDRNKYGRSYLDVCKDNM